MLTTLYLCEDLPDSVKMMIKQVYLKKIPILVLFSEQEYVSNYSQKLWNNRSFLPHGTKIDKWTREHPILLLDTNTFIENKHSQFNNPKLCMIIDQFIDTEYISSLQIERKTYMISNSNQEIYKKLTENNQIDTTYKNINGKWETV